MNERLLGAIKEWLEKNGYAGLAERTCLGCSTERLCPCGVLLDSCKPAYKYMHINNAEENCPDWGKCFEKHVIHGVGMNACVYYTKEDCYMFYHEDRYIHCRVKKEEEERDA